ncbi:MAG: class B sortase [Bacilli bacterium]|nr:class B sortase [Bacilli bacterium]
MIKKRRRLKWKNIIAFSLIIIFLITLTISTIDIIKWKLDSNKTDKQIKEIQEIIDIEEVIEEDITDEIEIIEQVEEIPQANPYWDYIEMNLININFNKLKQINSNTKGWIQVNGTNINYPFVQANDNKYYLTHSFDKSYNSAGWVFLDYRNNINEFSKNTIIYAHGRTDKTMFGSLKNILKSSWLNDTNNFVVKLSTEIENTLWQVFSVYHIPTTSDYIQVNFSSNKEFNNWTTMLINRSSYNFNTSVNENDNVLTLSTCYNDNEKVVLHAKLIKKETR